MANYKTHRNIGIASSVGATGVLFTFAATISSVPFLANVPMDISIVSMFLMVFFGFVGSIFPDIDLDYSHPAKFMRYFLVTFISVSSMALLIPMHTDIAAMINQSSAIAIGVIALISFSIPFAVVKFFSSIMVHRGVVHSIPFGIVSSIVLFEILSNLPAIGSYINPFMIAVVFFVGFITHLALDEAFSVDLLGARIKSSFGTALKVFDSENMIGTVILYGLLVAYIAHTLNLFSF